MPSPPAVQVDEQHTGVKIGLLGGQAQFALAAVAGRGLLRHGQGTSLQVKLFQGGQVLQGQGVAVQVQHAVHVLRQHPPHKQPRQGAQGKSPGVHREIKPLAQVAQLPQEEFPPIGGQGIPQPLRPLAGYPHGKQVESQLRLWRRMFAQGNHGRGGMAQVILVRGVQNVHDASSSNFSTAGDGYGVPPVRGAACSHDNMPSGKRGCLRERAVRRP